MNAQHTANQAGLGPTTDAAHAAMVDYVDRLKRHDWMFQYSDDFGVYMRGREQRRVLQEMQRTVDPDHSIWNEFAPADFRHN